MKLARPLLVPAFALSAALLALAAPVAHAERPMNVDDAGTLTRGDAKLEFGVFRDDETYGLEAAAGYGPIDGVEVEIGLSHARDEGVSPAQPLRGRGFALKWVPHASDTGASFGLKYEYGVERSRGSRPELHALVGLFTWTFDAGPRLHLNLGRERTREHGHHENTSTWGVGLDWPLSASLDLTAETFGARHAGPDRALGLRWRLADGLKLSAAVGHGQARNFANAGIAWEF